MMSEHINDKQWQELAGWAEAPEQAAMHLEVCRACAEELRDFRRQLSAYRDSNTTLAQRDEVFWQRQQAGIRSRLQQAERPDYSRFIIWAAAMLALCAGALDWQAQSQRTMHQQMAEQRLEQQADYELLVSIENDVNGPMPDAARPAQTLVAEMESNGAAEKSSKAVKESK